MFDELVVPQTWFFEKVDFCCGDRCLLCFWFKKVKISEFFRVFCAKREILELKHYVQDQTKPLTSQNHTFHSPRTTPQTVRPVRRFGTKLPKSSKVLQISRFFWKTWWLVCKGVTTKSWWKSENLEMFSKQICIASNFVFYIIMQSKVL